MRHKSHKKSHKKAHKKGSSKRTSPTHYCKATSKATGHRCRNKTHTTYCYVHKHKH